MAATQEKSINNFFDGLSVKVFRRINLEEIFFINKKEWRVKSLSLHEFIGLLLETTKLEAIRLEFPSRTEIRYGWGDFSIYELAQTVKSSSYFTHYTALYLHELTEQIPKVIYLNFEQPPKPYANSGLSQGAIDRAFRRPVRKSNTLAAYNDQAICLLNGKHTNNLGVIEILGRIGEKIQVANIERTLIDITVRPAYAGGVFEVSKAYKLAKERVSINRLSAFLATIDYTYPYHQAVGFYLEKAGVYKQSQINLLRKRDIKYDFYLAHDMKEMDYSKKWRLYFPKGF